MFTRQSVEIPVANQIMRGTLYRPQKPGKLPAVAIFHGLGSQQSRYFDRAEMLAKAGIITLIFSFRGCGESDGNFAEQTIAMSMADALAGYDFLVSQENVDLKRIGVWGGSYGGYLAACLSAMRPINSLVLSAPALYKNAWWDSVRKTLEAEWEAFKAEGKFLDTKAIQAIRQYDGALLLIQHEFDETCPKKLTQTYFDNAVLALPKEQTLIKGVGHSLIEEKHRQQSNQITTDWFVKTL